MSISCPVCDRPQVEELVCPNCGADLSSYQMLVKLPLKQEVLSKKKVFYLWLSLATLFLLFGLGLGTFGKSIVAKQVIDKLQDSTKIIASSNNNLLSSSTKIYTIKNQNVKREDSDFLPCGGFNYVVRSGDSLSSIASRFYGNFNDFSWIRNANLQLKGREGYIEIGERILIPNLEC